jgi:dethiobiotin synthetase
LKSFFLTGTDTGVGKTFIGAGLLLAAQARGLRTAGIKPLAAGGAPVGGGCQNEDVLIYARLSSPPLRYADVNAVTLSRAMAPHVAAAGQGIELSAAKLNAWTRRAAEAGSDFTIVEGAGGWMVPLNDEESMADVASMLRFPVILVAGMRLGCLNHALLTAAAVRSRGLLLAGWVANSPWPPMAGLQENVTALARRLGAPCLGRVPFLGTAPRCESIVPYLDLVPLLT